MFNFTHCGSQLSNANFREIEVFAFAADAQMTNANLISSPSANLCRYGEYPVDVTIRNNGPGFLGPIEVEVSIEGGTSIKESVDMAGVTAGNSKTFRLSKTLSTARLGSGIVIRGEILTPDTDNDNNVFTRTRTSISTPTGSVITPTSTFPGFPTQGTFFERDLITYGKTFVYEITPPSSYTNQQHGTNWFSTFSIRLNGAPLAGSKYNYVGPSGANNARISLNLTEEDAEGELVMNFNVLDLAGNGCDTNATRHAYVAPMPNPKYEGTAICLGDKLQYQNQSTIKSGTMSYVWTFGDGNGSVLFEPQHAFADTGVFFTKLVATSNLGFKDSVTLPVIVSPTPTADFIFQNQCGSLPVPFENKSTIAAGKMHYTWNFGDGSISDATNPMHTYTQAGPYEVTLEVESEGGCFASVTKSAYSYPNPKADFIGPNQICVGTPVNFLNQTQIAFSNWGSEWVFGENEFRTFNRNPQYRFRDAGEKEVKLKVTTQYGCVDSISKILVLNPGPFIDITHSDACINNNITFNSNVVIPAGMSADFIWNIDGNLYADANPEVVFSSIGAKKVTVSIDYENGCSATETKMVETGYKPQAGFTLGTAICAGVQMALENTTTIEFDKPEYTWIMGDGMVYNDFAPSHIYNVTNPTPMTVMLIASSAKGACPDTALQNITVGIVPVCDFEINNTYLPGHRAYQFVPEHKGASYQWFFGDGNTSTSESPIYQYRRDGQFPVRVLVTTAEGCQCEASAQHTVYNLSVVSTNAASGVQVYPNPSNGILYLESTNKTALHKVEVVNAVGATILNQKLDPQAIVQSIDLSHVATGVYTIKVETANAETVVHRIIIAN